MYMYTNLNIRAICGSAEQPLLGPSKEALNQPRHILQNYVKVIYDLQWKAEDCSKETPDWNALEAAKALTSWALT